MPQIGPLKGLFIFWEKYFSNKEKESPEEKEMQ